MLRRYPPVNTLEQRALIFVDTLGFELCPLLPIKFFLFRDVRIDLLQPGHHYVIAVLQLSLYLHEIFHDDKIFVPCL